MDMAEFTDAKIRRERIPTRKGFQNSLVEKTGAFNKQTKLLQRAIASVHSAIEGEHDTTMLERVTVSLEINKQAFESSYRNLERLFTENRWGESADVESQVKATSIKYIQSAESALCQVTEKLNARQQLTKKLKSTDEKDEVVLKDSRSLGRSKRSRSSYASSTSARMKALADAAAARKKAEYDVLITERENERKQLEAEEERDRIAARAQHKRDMAVLAATKRKASAEAKLKAIEQSINEERSSSNKSEEGERSSVMSRLRTKAWIQDQQRDKTQLESKRLEAKNLGVRMRTEKPRMMDVELSHTDNELHIKSQTQEVHGNLGAILQGSMKVATTNEKLASNQARISLPKCHPDLFSGDPTMFHPWKSGLKGMLHDTDVTPEQEMNYLHTYTRAGPQKLVDSFRKRQSNNMSVLLNDLWKELEKRYGNAATITNTFLVRLKEQAKFGEHERKKLQAFSDLCIDIARQIDQLPGLGCLNYSIAIRPILNSLPEYIRRRWEKIVVEYAEENHDAYPDFQAFADMIEKQSLLRNHPNVTATFESTRKEKGATWGRDYKVLKEDVEIIEESDNEKYCTFHDMKAHNLPECKAFSQKTLQERTQWLKKAGLCYRCLMQKHLAKECKRKVKCTKCGSDRHLKCFIWRERKGKKRKKCHQLIRTPKLVDELGITGTKDKYFLSTCSAKKETKYGRRVSGLTITSMNGVSKQLPTLVECDNIPTEKHEIPTTQLVKQYEHLRKIADEIPPLDTKAQVQLLIGRDAPEIMKVREVRNGPKGAPWAHKLAIGWTVCGRLCVNRQGAPVHVQTHRTVIQSCIKYFTFWDHKANKNIFCTH
ncbi:Hypothetical predicted protein [Paramuricea clavata]|uniref:Uncharacterized protein n=1 Tax=Paramuricea clavata TaxID=317549 RepID=A0A6S7FQV0_PARCT|nr:Hypothetical predicted protein [Paramuricea clavata]